MREYTHEGISYTFEPPLEGNDPVEIIESYWKKIAEAVGAEAMNQRNKDPAAMNPESSPGILLMPRSSESDE